MPADLKDRLDAAAAESRRSLTAEIINRLTWSFTAGKDAVSEQERLDRIEETQVKLNSVIERLLQQREGDGPDDPAERFREWMEGPEGQAARRKYEEQWDADMAAREASGENIEPLPRAGMRKGRFEPAKKSRPK